ncbi:right-handed parallel beta-helix repeat-containing protein [Dyadobacter luticola]|nr:right-handed parallel beta-helix repeat-containing protein [Dyadobacter luticola]
MFIAECSYASTFYVKSGGGSGSGLDDANAWNLTKLNATRLAPGDRVLFKRGDVFYGIITCNSGGNSDNPIIYDAYGNGENPVISGFSQHSGWKQLRGNIYYVPLDVPSLNLVTVDGAVKGMGRFPDTGYLPYTSHIGNEAIGGAAVAELPFDPAGGEVVIRKTRWILDRHLVKSRNASTLTYTTSSDYGSNASYSPVDGNGFFIQNHLETLSSDGEWFYDKAAKRLYVYFEGAVESRVVKASAQMQNVYLNYWTNIQFRNLDFEGGNIHGIYLIGTSNVKIDHCNVRNQGGNGIWGSYITNLSITNSTIHHSLNNGIHLEQEGKSILVDQVKISDTGNIAGAAKSGDGAQEGIFLVGEGLTVTNSSIVNSGYIGINFEGNNVLIERNYVDTFSNVKDDGAGIYTYNPGDRSYNRIVRKNIVLNAKGAFAGAEGHFWEPFGKAAGIYLDDRSRGTIIDQNTVANGNWGGIFLHNTGDVQVTSNLVYNFAQQLLFVVESADINRNFIITGNRFIARTASQKTAQINLAVKDDIKKMGVFDNNIYARPIDDNQTFTVFKGYEGGMETNLSLDEWKAGFAMDANSVKSKVKTDQDSNIRFEYNYSDQESTVPISSLYSDVAVKRYSSNVKIPAYSGVVLVSIPKLSVVESTGSGDWDQPGLWSGGYVPGPEDAVRINKEHIIQVDEDIVTRKIDVSAGAELHFLGNHKVQKAE